MKNKKKKASEKDPRYHAKERREPLPHFFPSVFRTNNVYGKFGLFLSLCLLLPFVLCETLLVFFFNYSSFIGYCSH